MADEELKAAVAGMPVPDLRPGAFTEPRPLGSATVALATTAGLIRSGDPLWRDADDGFRVVERDERDLIVAHQSVNFDRAGVAADLNVAFPIDRLEELAADGVVGRVEPRHLTFTGPILELTTVRLDTGPAAARRLLADDVDVVILTPV